MATPRFKCKLCGACCINLIAHAYKALPTDEDFRRWEDEGREDIQASFELVEDDSLINNYADTEDDTSICPWLYKLPDQDKYICLIQDTKPLHCRNYPVSKWHAESTGCSGFAP